MTESAGTGVAVLGAIGNEDYAAAARLHGRCFAEGWSSETLRKSFDIIGTIGIAACDGREGGAGQQPLSGMAIVRTIGDQADLLTICVDPDQRGKGIGRYLLAAVEETAHRLGAATIFLEVAERNEPATRLYHHAGYIIAGRRLNYYTDPTYGSTAVVMKKALGGKNTG